MAKSLRDEVAELRDANQGSWLGEHLRQMLDRHPPADGVSVPKFSKLNDAEKMRACMDSALSEPNMRRYQIAMPDGVIDWRHGFKDGWIAAVNLSDDDARDAARYRWLRENAGVVFTQTQCWELRNGQSIYSTMPGHLELDAAIDAAIAQPKDGNEK